MWPERGPVGKGVESAAGGARNESAGGEELRAERSKESVKSEPSTLPPCGPNIFYYADEDPPWDEEEESNADSAFFPVKQEVPSESESGKSSESQREIQILQEKLAKLESRLESVSAQSNVREESKQEREQEKSEAIQAVKGEQWWQSSG